MGNFVNCVSKSEVDLESNFDMKEASKESQLYFEDDQYTASTQLTTTMCIEEAQPEERFGYLGSMTTMNRLSTCRQQNETSMRRVENATDTIISQTTFTSFGEATNSDRNNSSRRTAEVEEVRSVNTSSLSLDVSKGAAAHY